MMSRDQRKIFLTPQNERDQGAQTAVTHDKNRPIPRQVNLLKDFVRSGDGFDEDRNFVRNGIGHWNQIRVRQGEKLSERTVAPEDSKHGAIGTMAPEASSANRASVASHVDLPDYAPSTNC